MRTVLVGMKYSSKKLHHWLALVPCLILLACSADGSTPAATSVSPGSSTSPGVYSLTKNEVDSWDLMTFLAFSPRGDLYVSDPTRDTIFMVSSPNPRSSSDDVKPFAGSGSTGSKDGSGAEASFNHPTGLAFSPSGVLYVADTGNNKIRAIDKDGNVSTLAGSGITGSKDGSGAEASFNHPTGLAFSPSGVLYVADTGNNALRGVSPSGDVIRLGGILVGEIDSDSALYAMYSAPVGLVVNSDGIVYMADTMNRRLVKMTPNKEGLDSYGFAGSGEASYLNGVGTLAAFAYPTGLALAPDGTLYIGDFGKHRVRVADQEKSVSTPSWSTALAVDPQRYQNSLLLPEGVSAASDGFVYVADTLNNRIAKVSPEGEITTLAGNGSPGFKDGSSTTAQFSYPSDITTTPDGTIYVADTGNNRIRKITPDGMVSTVAGGGDSSGPDIGSPALGSFIVSPISVLASDSGYVYVADWGNHRIVRFTPGSTLELVAGSLPKGYEDGTGKSAKFRRPSGLAFTKDGSLFVSDATNGYIRSIDSGNRTSTVAGEGPPKVESIDAKLGDLYLNMPHGLDTLQNGSVLIADLGSNRIMLFDGSTLVKVSGGSQGFADGSLDSAKFYYPTDLTVTPNGIIYVADTGNNEIRKLVLDPALLKATPGT